MKELPWILALILLLMAGWTDWRTRRIPNWLTVPGLLTGLLANWLVFGPPGLWMALKGAGLGLALLLPLVLVRGLGAGDWKLIGAVGAILGAAQMLLVLLGTVLITGLMGVVQITRARRWKGTLKNILEIVLVMTTFGVRSRPDLTIDNPGLLKLPFGTAAAIAAVAVYGALKFARAS